MDILSIISSILDKFLPSADKKLDIEKAKIAVELQKALLEHNLIKAQTDINAEEAKSNSMFVAGWRPFIGWVCGFAFAFNYVGLPVLTWFYVAIMGQSMPPLPEFDMMTLMTLLSGMLGLGFMRSYDKKQELQNKKK
jgi:hypothetical protein